MPAFGAVQTPTALASGEKIALLSAEDLANNALSMAVSFSPQPAGVRIAIVNHSGQSVSLVASYDNKSDGSTYFPVYSPAGTAATVPDGQAWVLEVASGLFYAIKAGGAITAGTVWLAR